MDGIDAVLIDFATDKPQLISALCHPYPEDLRAQLQNLTDEKMGHGELNLMGRIDRQVGLVFAEAVNTLLANCQTSAEQIIAIGSHGQTIRHYPNGEDGFTMQIGDPDTIAVNTGIDVVADFRKKDVALGGQGAPMVPAFHEAVFRSNDVDRVIVNLGGIANLTFLPKNLQANVIGYDTGPANTLSDQWCQQHLGKAHDNNGLWASGGHCIDTLLAQMLLDPYFALPYPKSTGRELFKLKWLEQFVQNQSFEAQDVQNTLIHLSARSLALEINKLCSEGEVYVCGGGSHNAYLIDLVKSNLNNFKVSNTSELGVDPDWVEAATFAWLARAYKLKKPGNIPSVTGAKSPAVLGCAYFAK